MPGPVVGDDHLAAADAHLDRRAVRAVLDGVVEQVRDGALEQHRIGLDERGRERGDERAPAARAPARARRPRRRDRRAGCPRAGAGVPRRAPARRDRRRASSARRARPTPRRARAAPRPREAFPRGSGRRSCAPRSAACAARATRRRPAGAARRPSVSSAASISLKRDARRPSSSPPPTSTRSVRLPVVATALCGRCQPSHRPERSCRDERREPGGKRDPDPADQRRSRSGCGPRARSVGRRVLCDDDRAAGLDRLGEHADVVPADGGRVGERRALAGATCFCGAASRAG